MRANPDKTRAIMDMKPPKSIKEVQCLNGRLAALNRYLSKSAEKSLPFFKTLKNCLSKKNFVWTNEAEEAFEGIKREIGSLPMLVAPKVGETLYLYLAAAHEAVSAVLMAERDSVQLPIYFVSRALRGPEVGYPLLEKLALSLVSAARRLRRYFQAHQVIVITDQPIRQVLQKPEISGRLAKWAIELGEHGIEYQPRNAIKGQVLADFLVEMPSDEHVRVEESPKPVTETKRNVQEWSLHTDGSSNHLGSGAGLILVDPEGIEYTYALRFNFQTSNNESEYEALLAGLRLAKKLNVQHLRIHVDSKLVANQINGEYEARDTNMKLYLEEARNLMKQFQEAKIEQVPRSRNHQADALSKLASVAFDHLTKKVLVEVLEERSIETKKINVVVEEEGPSWMTPIIEYLKEGTLPHNAHEAKQIQSKANRYILEEGVLYKRSFLGPLLRCVGPLQANYVIREIHEGSCGMHSGPRSVVSKIINTGYFWPTMHRDAMHEIQRCDACQKYAPVPKLPKQDMVSVIAAWPFQKWGMDIVGPFPEAPGRVKFLLVAVDYFTKWVEAMPLATITGRNVKRFVWDNIVCRFGLPKEIVTDNGKQFSDNPFRSWCEEMCIRQIFTSVAHPQGNGQVERINRSMVEGLKTRVEANGSSWVDHLPHVLWAHRTMPKTSHGETPFSLTYGSEAVIPAEIGIPSHRQSHIGEGNNEQELLQNLDLLEERREIASIREAKYKRKIEQYYNKRVRPFTFRPGDYVLRKNEASRVKDQGKMGPNWEGPYKVTTAFGNGSYTLADPQGKILPRSWNGNNLRKYYL